MIFLHLTIGPTVRFTNEVEAVRTEVNKLKNAGVKIIIGLSHAGYGMDKKVAAEVEGIDVIVGGHSHTFLYTLYPGKWVLWQLAEI